LRRPLHTATLPVIFAVSLSATAAAQTAPTVTLLPTEKEAARVQALVDAFENHRSTDVARDYGSLKSIVQDFVIRQLNAAPAISDAALRSQLEKIVSRRWSEEDDGGLYVRSASGWGPRSKDRLWAVAYVVWLGTHGDGGTGAVLDSYVWEPKGTRLVARQDRDLAGYSMEGNWLSTGPDQLAIMLHGRLSGSNGLGGWKAVVYVCQRDGMRALWRSPLVLGLTAIASDKLIALRHAQPCPQAASSACAYTYEIYSFDNWPPDKLAVTLVSRTTR
jgi:hypothetical protein